MKHEADQPVLPLSDVQFSDALRRGMGRALAHIREYGAKGHDEAIVNACLTSLGYDPQSEGTRGEWLWAFLDAADLREAVRPQVLSALRQADCESDTWTVAQLFVLALLYAKGGDKEARQTIYDKFDQQQFKESWLGGLQIILLDGMDGMLHVARVLGARLLSAAGFWDDGYLTFLAAEELGKADVMDALAKCAQTDERVKAYAAEIGKREQKDWPQPPVADVEDVLAAIEKPKDRCIWLRRWGREASDEQVKAVHNALIAETRPVQLAKLLRVFGARPLPGLPTKILDLAESQDGDLSYAAIRAFEGKRDETIRSRALEMLNRKPPVLDAIRLLASNYEVGDHALIESVLPEDADPDTLHSVGLAILKLTDEVKDQRLSACLEWLYEAGPCSECRYFAVDRLIELGTADERMLRECLLDCSDDTRKAARESLGLPAEYDGFGPEN